VGGGLQIQEGGGALDLHHHHYHHHCCCDCYCSCHCTLTPHPLQLTSHERGPDRFSPHLTLWQEDGVEKYHVARDGDKVPFPPFFLLRPFEVACSDTDLPFPFHLPPLSPSASGFTSTTRARRRSSRTSLSHPSPSEATNSPLPSPLLDKPFPDPPRTPAADPLSLLGLRSTDPTRLQPHQGPRPNVLLGQAQGLAREVRPAPQTRLDPT